MLNGSFFKHQLNFKFPAGTSRGILHKKDTWFLKIWDNHNTQVVGVGECGPLTGLSPDPIDKIEEEIILLLNQLKSIDLPTEMNSTLSIAKSLVPETLPALRFALETALLDLINGGERKIFDNGFHSGRTLIPINGLIWMNNKSDMIRQAKDKIADDFTCIKMKIGAINFEEELEVLSYIRQYDPKFKLTLRVDANGAFEKSDALEKLKRLQEFKLHSIEQPIAPGSWKEMAELCQKSPIPIALDEELIGMNHRKEELLEMVKPAYIVLKPTLLGGFAETREWIDLASRYDIGCWITSMLESNIGLNAISQFAADMAPEKVHGLGTGRLYSNNIESPLTVQNGHISYISDKKWDYSLFPDH